MARVPTFSPNPYANFDPSQWTDPYSQFQSSALPWPSSYSGWPTDAMGRPIQAPPGMTLNSQPAAAQPAAAQPQPQSGAFSPQQADRILQATGNWGLSGPSGSGMGGQNNQMALVREAALTAGYRPQPAQSAAPMPTPAANPSGLTSQQYLSLLANPGNVATPGATAPQASPGWQPSNSVLQQFLANWNPAASGPGSQFGQNFMRALGGR